MKRLMKWWRARRARAVHRREAAAWQASADRHYLEASRLPARSPRKVYHYCLSFRDAERAEAHRALAEGTMDGWNRAAECDRDAAWWDERARQRGVGEVVQWTGAAHAS